jgi:hypothetical protein
MIVACLALAVALSGTGYAAIVLPKGSVGTVHLKRNAVTSVKVKDSSLRLADFARAERGRLVGAKGDPGAPGPKGDKGDRGEKGDTGDRGPSGLSDLEVVARNTAPSSVPIQLVSVTCPAGKRLVSGGGAATAIPGLAHFGSHPNQLANPTGWVAAARETTTVTANWSVYAYALCARSD